jgi:hypothetical protein
MEIENQFGNNGEVRTYAQTPNFSIGLGHVLSGIIAHLSSTVISATMAWHLVIKESRFQFSHEFSRILLSQFESWLKDEMRLISSLSSNQKANLENDYEENHYF